jgi:hypothetical protein
MKVEGGFQRRHRVRFVDDDGHVVCGGLRDGGEAEERSSNQADTAQFHRQDPQPERTPQGVSRTLARYFNFSL